MCRREHFGRGRRAVAGWGHMRKHLEGPAAELAARRMDQRHCVPLPAAADALLAVPRDSRKRTAAWAEFDELFHRTIAATCDDRRLAADVNRYRLHHKGFNRISTDPMSLQPAMAEHQAMLDAIEAGKGALARETMVPLPQQHRRVVRSH